MKSYVAQQHRPIDYVIAVGVALLLVGAIIFALTRHQTEKATASLTPLQASIITQAPSAAPAAAPPAPALIEPPEPYIPPPKLNIAAPPKPIKNVTHKKPTKEKKTKHSSQAKQNSHSQSQNNEGKEGQSNGAAKSAAPNPGDHSAGAQPINNVQPEYPLSAQEQSREGNVTAVCDILANGKPAHCKILKVRGGHDFAESAMDFLENSPVRYQPAVVNGQAVIEHNHVLHIDFVLTDGMD